MSTKQKILVIDDEVDFTFFVKKNLEQTGQFEVSVQHDGKQGLEQARTLQPHLILLDVMMPGMPGEEVINELKRFPETKQIPVVFLTAIVRPEETAAKANVIGGQHFVAKPVKMDELLKVIRSLI